MGASNSKNFQLSAWDLEMIEISWSFVKDKQHLGVNTMVRIFDTSRETKRMFLFVSNLELTADMMQNTKVHYHANQVIKTLEKIVILFTKSLISEQDKEKLVELGKRHYHVGLKKEHFKVFENCFIKSLEESLNVSVFHEKFENPWRKLIQYIFKQYTDGMNFEEKEEIKFADRILDIYTS